MTLFDLLSQKKDKRFCVVCGRKAPEIIDACGLCAREARDRGETEMKIVPLCSVRERPECSSRHAKEKHPMGLLAETDPNWR